MSDWRSRATPVIGNTSNPKPVIDDIGVQNMNEADVLQAISPKAAQEPVKSDWRTRAEPVQPQQEAPKEPIMAQNTPKEPLQNSDNMGLSPAQEYQNEQPLIRTLGRGGRSVASGISSIADLALLPIKTTALGAGLAAEKMGAEEVGRGLQKFGTIPTMSDTTKAIIDKSTGDRLKPTGTIDKIGDFAAETITSALPFAKGGDVVNAVKKPNVKDVAESIFLNKRQAPEKITSSVLSKKASESYKRADEIGGSLKAEFTDKFVDSIDKLRPQTEAGKILGGDDAFSKVVDKMQALRGKPITLQAAQEVDEFLGDAIDTQSTMGFLNKQGKKLLDIQSTFREMIEGADDALIDGGKDGFEAIKQGRKLWSQQLKLRDVERIIQRAEMTDNPATAIKTGFRTLLNNPKRIKGFSKDEQKAIKKAAESGELTDFLRTGGSKLLSMAATIKGGPALGAAVYGGSALSKNAATRVQLNKATKIADLLIQNSGVKQAAKNPALTNQGIAALLSATNSSGQKLLPKPEPKDLARLLSQ